MDLFVACMQQCVAVCMAGSAVGARAAVQLLRVLCGVTLT